MYYKFFLNFFSASLIALVQLSFLVNLPFGLNKINLVLLVLIFILGLFDFKTALWWALGMGFIFDLYSFSPFGLYMIIFLATIISLNFLLVNFFTNRSLYSFLVLSILSFFIFEFLARVLIYIINFFDINSGGLFFYHSFYFDPFWTTVYNLLAVVFIFNFLNFVSRKLQPFFLFRK